MSDLRIRILIERGLFLDLDGRLTAANAHRLDAVIEHIFDGDEAPPMVALDLPELSFVDDGGLAALVRAAELAKQAGTSMVLREPTRAVVRMLNLAGLGDLVRAEPSLVPRR